MDPVAVPDYPDNHVRQILAQTRTIAMVGASANWTRPSYYAMKYLLDRGYTVFPVNPAAAGQKILDREVYPDLSAVPGPIDMVDIFRRSEHAGAITDEAIALKDEKRIQVIWMQLGVIDTKAAARAEAAGLSVIMDRCPKIEYGRLHHELSWGGFNSRMISAKRPKVRLG